MRKQNQRNRGFTLIELLVVISIIGVLAGLLFPAINAAMKKAKVAKAQTEVHAIETAWKSYFNEYGQWPVDSTAMTCLLQPAGESTTANPSDGIATTPDVSELLLGSKTAIPNYVPATHNPKGIQFINLKLDPTTAQFQDPWGHPYYFLFDVNYDNQIDPKNTNLESPLGKPIARTVIVWSYGPDGKSTTAGDQADDIRSW